MKLALVNVKGGVGKTTTAVNLSAALARSGRSILVVDLDPQGSATTSFGVSREDAVPSIADVFFGEVKAKDAICETGIEGIDLLPSSLRLAGADLLLAGMKDPDKLLKNALAGLRYDAIILDCPPGLSLLTTNALAAADAYIVPVLPRHLDIDALEGFFEALKILNGRLGKIPGLLGILLTQADYRTRATHEAVTAIRGTWGKKVFRTEIPVNIRLAEAPAHGSTVFEYESWSKGAIAYGRLGGEVVRVAKKAKLL